MNKETDEKIFCENLKQLRLALKYSKKKMAEILNVGIYTLTMLESGVIPPSLSCEILCEIYVHFGIRPRELFNEDFMKNFSKIL